MERVKFSQTGRSFKYPILIVLALGLAKGIERLMYIMKTKGKTNKVWTQLVHQ